MSYYKNIFKLANDKTLESGNRFNLNGSDYIVEITYLSGMGALMCMSRKILKNGLLSKKTYKHNTTALHFGFL